MNATATTFNPNDRVRLPNGQLGTITGEYECSHDLFYALVDGTPESQLFAAASLSLTDSAATPASAMYGAIWNNQPVGAAYGMSEFFEQFSKDHSMTDEEVRALWMEQRNRADETLRIGFIHPETVDETKMKIQREIKKATAAAAAAEQNRLDDLLNALVEEQKTVGDPQ